MQQFRTTPGAPRRGRASNLILFGVIALALALVGPLGCGSDEDSGGPDVTTGSISGSVIEPISGGPVNGATVSISPVSGKKETTSTTDLNGDYTLSDVEEGTYTLTIDASAVVADPTNSNLEFVNTTQRVTVVAGQNVRSDAAVPVIDVTESEQPVGGQPTVLQPASIPGLRVDIPADAVTFPDGTSTGALNVVQVGFDQGPSPVATGHAPSVMFRILPEGTTFNPPATIQFPNRDGLAGGRTQEVFSFDAAQQTWASDGMATATGITVNTDAGVGISAASTHYVVSPATSVSGNITDPSQQPVAGAMVKVWARVDPLGDGSDLVELEGVMGTTDAAGDFTIAGVRASNISVSALLASSGAAGQLDPTSDVANDGTGSTDVGNHVMDVLTETIFSVDGVVTFEDDSPAAGVDIGWYDPSEQNKQWTTTASDGSFSLELQHAPGVQLGIYAWDSASDYGQDERFVVPSLDQSGVALDIDLQICRDEDSDSCREWGTWSLSGNTLSVSFSNWECGGVVTESDVATVLSLQNGVLTVQVEEDGETMTMTMSRVSGSGPSGVSAANLPGIYHSQQGGFVLALYAGGTLTMFEGEDDGIAVEYGTYANETNNSFDITFLHSDDSDPPPLNTPMSMTYSILGSTMTINDTVGGEPDTFDRCANGPNNGPEGQWSDFNGDGTHFALIIYNGEFAGTDREGDSSSN